MNILLNWIEPLMNRLVNAYKKYNIQFLFKELSYNAQFINKHFDNLAPFARVILMITLIVRCDLAVVV